MYFELLWKCDLTAKPEEMQSISNITEALKHYRSKKGGSVSGNENLFDEMKSDKSFQKYFSASPEGEIIQEIKKKVEESLKNNGGDIQNSKNERKALQCMTLGCYCINIEYNHTPVHGDNTVNIRLFGSDKWDFETSKNASWFRNLTHETIPKLLARYHGQDGIPFDITYDFTLPVVIHAD